MDVHLRGIDADVWQALRLESVRRGVSVARVIETLWLRTEHHFEPQTPEGTYVCRDCGLVYNDDTPGRDLIAGQPCLPYVRHADIPA